jgi:hypothetical protein
MIMKLRDDWIIFHPQKSCRDFHATFLGNGTIYSRLLH